MNTYLEDDNDNKSSICLMSFIALGTALLIIAILNLWLDKPTAASFTHKVVQKFAETKQLPKEGN